jgi:ABC-type polar amino acid transport system ATPase subunit
MPSPIIQFQGVAKWFGTVPVLRGIDLNVEEGSIAVVCGPSGSGKSTLLRCVNGLERVQQGMVSVFGRHVDDSALRSADFRAGIGMVFQRFSLYPHKSVLNNLLLGPRLVRNLPRREAAARATRMLERVGVADKIDAMPSQLSGGQQQRVAIARALVMEPRIMLFDEPTSALDPEMIREVLDVMRDLARSGMTMLIVTHEMGFAREVADRVVFMDEGEIVEEDEAAAFFAGARTERARRFIDNVLHH